MLKHFFHRDPPRYAFDPARQEPAVRVSICTGERTAGFFDRETRMFAADHLITSEKELEDFCRACGTAPDEIRKIY